MSELRKAIRSPDVEAYLLDADALEPGELKDFYQELVRSEARHHAIYLQLARRYFDPERVERRLDELLDLEASVARTLPLRPALH